MTLPDAQPVACSFQSLRLPLNYLDWGNAGAPTLVLLHGGRDHARSWDWVAEALREDWHVVAPDLRGHGDSGWSADGAYGAGFHVHDLAEFVAHLGEDEVSIVAHSYGGIISLRYAGLFPERVRRLVAIEGVGPPPPGLATRIARPVAERWRGWIEERRAFVARPQRRYDTLDQAVARMRAENPRLTDEQARHLTVHGMNRNDDGSWSWKFDPQVRTLAPFDATEEELHALWARIACPVLLVHGTESWAPPPDRAGRAAHFADVRVATFDGAGHWVQHDRLDPFLQEVQAFLR